MVRMAGPLARSANTTTRTLQDEADSISLYELLENEIIPSYFERDANGLPTRWLAMMKEAMRTCAPAFSMSRMVKEYTTRFYVPEIQQGEDIQQQHYGQSRVLATWKESVRKAWPGLELYVDGRRDGQLSLGEAIAVRAWVKSTQLTPEDLTVELVYGQTHEEQVVSQQILLMNYVRQEQDGSYRYELRLQPDDSGSFAYGVRVLPESSRAVWEA